MKEGFRHPPFIFTLPCNLKKYSAIEVKNQVEILGYMIFKVFCIIPTIVKFYYSYLLIV